MNFADVSAEILRLTRRPDKATSAAIAINRAVSYCTVMGEFDKDTIEASIAIDGTLYGDTVSLAGLTRFRRFTYVKPTGVLYYLSKLDGDKIFTPKNNMQPNVYYISGTSLTYTLSALATSLEVSYLTYPITLDAVTNTTHWMLDMMPAAIIDLATARVFAEIGDDASARQYQNSGMELFLAVKRDLSQGD